MATREQYEYFKSLYDEEEHTYELLEGRAKLYLTIISLFLGGLLLKAQEVRASAAAMGIPWWCFSLLALILAISLCLVVMAMRIRTFEVPSDPEELIKGFGAQPPSNSAFFDDRLVDYAVATKRNSAVNNASARLLQYAAYALTSAMILLLLTLIVALSFVRSGNDTKAETCKRACTSVFQCGEQS